ncbi:MAG: hypothetical protein R2813_03730 [Flavobacteriales bacterium]
MLKQLFASLNALNLFAVALTIGLVVPLLVQDGMFMDAMLYTSVAHNLSEGIGSFWYPQFSYLNVSELDAFHEQPPLGFGIQAKFFSCYWEVLCTPNASTQVCVC